MENSHHLPIALNNHGKNSWMFCSTKQPRNLVVFVHGFGGKSVETWFTFESLLPSHGVHSDIVFYGYDAFFERIQPNAVFLEQTLNEILSAPSRFLATHARHVGRRKDWDYGRVVLVAHSMGAVVCRRALLFALKARRHWPEKVRLVLFAPAHVGVDDAVRLALGIRDPLGVGAVASRGLKLASGALRDLLQRTTFTKLADDTRVERQRDRKRSRCLVAAQVVFGSKENVVSQDRFGEDPFPPLYFRGKSHSAVCKPNAKFADPVKLVAAELL